MNYQKLRNYNYNNYKKNKDFDLVFMLHECQLPISGMSVTNRHLFRLVWISGLDHIEGIRPDNIEG